MTRLVVELDHPDADKNISKIAKMQDPDTIVLCSAISEIFLRKMAKQGYIKYVEGSEFVDTREDLIEQGDPTGGDLKELDEKNRNRIENLKDMVLYRFGSTGVVQVLSKAAQLLGLVPVFPVRNTSTFSSGASESKFVFRDCVLVKKGSTVGDVARKVMGDAPIAYIEGVGGLRVAEDDVVAVGKHDVRPLINIEILVVLTQADSIIQGWAWVVDIHHQLGQKIGQSTMKSSQRVWFFSHLFPAAASMYLVTYHINELGYSCFINLIYAGNSC